MVIDFKYGITGENPCGVKIVDGELTAKTDIVEEVTFCNFPRIKVKGLNLYNCAFEDCAQISITKGQVENCRFYRLKTLYLGNTILRTCILRHLHCENHSLLYMEDSLITGCTFGDISLEKGTVICSAIGKSWVDDCNFFDIRMNRKISLLFRQIEFVGRIIKRKREINILAPESHANLEEAMVIGCG